MKRLGQGERTVRMRTDRRIPEPCPVTEVENSHFPVLCREPRRKDIICQCLLLAVARSAPRMDVP